MIENAEEIMHLLEEFSKVKPKDIPRELEDYLMYVAKTGDPVFKWALVKVLFREKLVNVITDFYERTLTMELPPCPNVDPFNYERMKANLIERLDAFSGAPFTVQRICELLTNPWKEYKRCDKFMRAIEKNILVVSTREPGRGGDEESQDDSSINGLPGANDSSVIEINFCCNDVAGTHADSSSQSYQEMAPVEVNASVQVDIPNGNHMELSKDNEEKQEEVPSSNEIGVMSSEEVGQEIVIEEKESEQCVCSSLDLQQKEVIEVNEACQTDDIEPSESLVDSNTPEPNEAEQISVTFEETSEVTVSDDQVDDNIRPDEENREIAEEAVEAMPMEEHQEVVAEESKEAVPAEETKEVMVVEEAPSESVHIDVEDIKDSINVVDSSNGNERLNLLCTPTDSGEESSESNSSNTFEEARPECDTSNSFDSESNSWDSEAGVKREEEQPMEQGVEEEAVAKAADSTDMDSANEATAASSDSTDEPPQETKEEPEELSEAQVAIAESTEMDVGECQISFVDQSES